LDRTVAALVEQIRVISEGLLITQTEAATAKAAALDAKAANTKLKGQLEHQALSAPTQFEFRSRGNRAQYESNAVVITDLCRALTALEEGDPADLEASIRAGIIALNSRNKLVKLADNSSVGWAFIDEYSKCDLAEDDQDDRRIRRAEEAAIAKRKAKQEASNRARGASSRGFFGRGRGHYANQYGTQYAAQYGGGFGYQPVGYTVNQAGVGYGQQVGQQPQQYVVAPNPYASGPRQQAQSRQQSYQVPAPQAQAQVFQRPLGPCYVCGGAHLMRNCPGNAKQSEDVQNKIESQFDKQ
jgi:hypothetical protein